MQLRHLGHHDPPPFVRIHRDVKNTLEVMQWSESHLTSATPRGPKEDRDGARVLQQPHANSTERRGLGVSAAASCFMQEEDRPSSRVASVADEEWLEGEIKEQIVIRRLKSRLLSPEDWTALTICLVILILSTLFLFSIGLLHFTPVQFTKKGSLLLTKRIHSSFVFLCMCRKFLRVM